MLHPIQGGNNLPQNKTGVLKSVPEKGTGAGFSATHYSSDSVTLSYKNKSGEELSVQVEHTELKSVNLSRYSDMDKEKWKEIVESIRDEFKEFQAKSIRDILQGSGAAAKIDEPEKLSIEELEKRTEELIEKMPEFWRPESVSDRILGFATAFYGRTESEGEDFYELAKSSITEGFRLAGTDLGKLPGDIENVIEKTREMVMEKLDRWAEEQGILPDAEAQSGIDVTA